MKKTEEELKNEAEATATAEALAEEKRLKDEAAKTLDLSNKKKEEDEEDSEEEETVESLKAKLAKETEEKENYKKGLLAAKKVNKAGDEEDEDDSVEEEKTLKVKNVAEEAATKVIEKSNETNAISKFTEKYPALKDSDAWAKVVENYNPKNGKSSENAIMEDLEAALVLAKHYGDGKVAEQEVSLGNLASVSGSGSSHREENNGGVKDSTLQMGKMMGNSKEELEKASEDGANEIDMTH